ncbi:MAG: S41 family peptidase [Bernardetiaceae bacterium]|nr:S41 family peptidase [Bernardetiaceae bacterium]
MQKDFKFYTGLPLIIAITLAAGIFIGAKMFANDSHIKKSEDLSTTIHKIKQIFTHIDRDYVDTVDTEMLGEYAINQLLKKLDPHTSYTPARDLAIANSALEGDFEGIGIEFNIYEDTIQVVTPLAGGPAEKAGIKPGDRIIQVDGKNIAGIGITNRIIFDYLRGKKGTEVTLSVMRKNQKQPLIFKLKRDKIPTHTVEVAYMIDEHVAYIKVTRFGATTDKEFEKALESMQKQGMQKLMLDLRGNPGGYLHKAVKMADEFIAGKKMIVYTDGKADKFDSEELSGNKGKFEEGALIVLIDEGSASASEIVAGALQDYDRALIVGRRSYGKGLVQKPIPLIDGSELKLTISRYYTPSGRSIQKPYNDTTNYEQEVRQRYEDGEVYGNEVVKGDTAHIYKTAAGRTVYGGGGIMPDYFVSQDTSYYSVYLENLYAKNIMQEFASEYFNANEKQFDKYSDAHEFVKKFQMDSNLEQQFLAYAESQGVKPNPQLYRVSRVFILNRLKAQIGRLKWHSEAFYPIINQEDPIILKALTLFDEAEKLSAK